MRRGIFRKRLIAAVLCLLFSCNNVFALNAATDLLDHTSGVNPTTNGNVTNITTTHNIDTYHWSSFNLAGNETANFIFQANGQTALNYLSPGANPSAIYGAIMSSGAAGNILLFNPNGIMMGGGASISGANTFFASTNKFDGIVNGKVTFSEAEKNNPLTLGNIRFNNVNNAHFVAPNVIVNADNLTTSSSVSFRAIGGGEYDVNTNLFSNETGVKNPIVNKNILDVNANIASNKVTIEAKADADAYATAVISGDIKANKAVTGENGEVYIIASNGNTSSTAGMQVIQNALISGDSAKVNLNADRISLNGNIDVSGANGGSVNVNTKSLDQNANISAKGTNGEGGKVDLYVTDYTAVKDSTIDASGTSRGGEISIQGEYQVLSSGNYNASSSEGIGGDIKISAPLTKLYGANIDASGYAKGGNIYIGGAGTSGIDITDSYMTMINDGSILTASSSNGKGGNVYIDSLGETYAFGNINTSGKGSNGGYIELCGDESLKISQNINAGSGGTIYLDPKNIIITDSEIGNICYNMLFTDGVPVNVSLDLTNHSNFGSSIAIYNNLLAVGAEGSGSTYKGAAYLFYFTEGTKFSNLTLFKTLSNGVQVGSTRLNLADNANFGSSIALTNKLLAIGASGANSGDGLVYLFDFTADSKYNNLRFDNTLTGEIGQKSFGSSLALQEYTSGGTTYNLLAVGAQGNPSSIAGKEYLYSFTYSPLVPYSGFSLETSFTGSGSALGDNFGSGSALSTFTTGGTTYGLLAVGASGDVPVAGGAVYLYQFDLSTPNILTLKKTINKNNFSSIASGDAFGSSVALLPITISGLSYDLLAVGAENSDVAGAIDGGRAYYLSVNDAYAFSYDGGIGSGTAGTHMGSAVALGQTNVSSPTYNLLAIGLSGSSKGYTNAGEIYLYAFNPNTKYNNLSFAGQYYAGSSVKGVTSLSSYDLFGWSVALYENLLAIGAIGDKTGFDYAGAAYLYSFDQGTLYKNLTLNKKLAYGSNVLDTSGNVYTLNLKAADLFGFSVALSDGLLAVGAAGVDSGSKADTGAVYLFSFNSGTSYSSLTSDRILADGSMLTNGTLSLASGDYFGSAVALNNNLLAVGAEYTHEGSVSNTGAVYLLNFDKGTSTNPFNNITLIRELQSLPGSYTLAANDNFGNAVSLYDNQLAVGAYRTQTSGSETGAVYLFSLSSTSTPYDTITLETKLSSVPGYTLYNFGSSVSLYGNILAIGDMTDNSSAGSVYLFTINNNDYSNPVFSKKLENGSVLVNNAGGDYTLSLSATDEFGHAVSIYNYLLAIGAPGYTSAGGGLHSGAAYLLNIQGATLGDYIFTAYPSDTLYLSPTVLANWLSSSNVTLQANNNISFLSSLAVTGGVGKTLTLQAGGSITVNNNLTVNLGGADLFATANENTGTGLVDADHDSVIAEFTMNPGSSITTTGDVTIKMNTGAGKTFTDSGDITLEKVSGNKINVDNQGTSAGSDVIINNTITANSTSVADVSSIRTVNGQIKQNSTAPSTGMNISHQLNLSAGSGANLYDITLNNTNNNFKNIVSVSAGKNVSIKDTDALTMGAVTTGGNLTLVSGAGGSGNLLMDITSVGGAINLTANNGNITQNYNSASPIVQTVVGTTSLTTNGTGDINLHNSANNFTGIVTINSAGIAIIDDKNNLTMGTVNTGGLLTLVAGAGTSGSGNLLMDTTTVGANMNLTAYKGNIAQSTDPTHAINLTSPTGTTSLIATTGVADTGNINLNNTNNNFTGLVTITTAYDATIYDKNNLTMSTASVNEDLTLGSGKSGAGSLTIAQTTVGRNMTLTSPDNITQNLTGAGITVSGTTSLAGGTGTGNTINLSNPNNDFTGAVSIASGYDVNTKDATALLLGDSNITNDLTLTAGGDITQNAKIKVGNDTFLNTLADIILTNADNDFCYITSKNGAVNINNGATLPSDYAHSANLNDVNNIGLGDMNIFNGITLHANGYVAQKQTKKLNIIGSNSTITAGKYITVYTAKVGAPSSIATLQLQAGTINPDDVNLVAADIYGELIVNAAHDINVIEVITGHTHDVFSFTAENDINIGTLTQPTPTSIITGGATFTAAAGRSFNMIGNSAVNPTLIDTAGGNITITANTNSNPPGTAVISMLGNTLIDAGSGNVKLTINNGDVILNRIRAQNLTVDPTDITINNAIVIPGDSNFNATNDITVTNTGSVNTGGDSTFIAGHNMVNDGTLTTTGTSTFTIGNDITSNGLIQGTGVASDVAITAGRNIDIEGDLHTTGLAALTATDISIAKASTADGGFNILAQGSVTTDDLITTDNNISIVANNGSLNLGTSVTTGDINTGTGNVTIKMTKTTGDTTTGAISTGNITANNIDIENDNSGTSDNSNVNINGKITSTGFVELDGQNISIDDASTADGGFQFLAGCNVETGDLTTTTTGNAVVIFANLGAAKVGVDSSIITGNITATSGEVAIATANDVNNTSISVKNIIADDMQIDNQSTSGSSSITLLGNLTATGTGASGIAIGAPVINAANSTLTAGNITFSEPGTINAGTLSLITDNLDISNITGGTVTNLSYQAYTPTRNIANTELAMLFDAIQATNATLGSSSPSQTGNIGDSSATTVNFGNSIITATTQGNIYLNAAKDLNVDTLTAGGGVELTANKSISINTNVTASGGDAIMTANNGAHTGTANFTMLTGTTISAPNGEIYITIPNNAGAGTMTLSNLFGKTITAWHQSLAPGTDIIINNGSTITETSTTESNPLLICSDAGNFTNKAGALVTSGDRRWLVYTGSPAETTLGGLTPVNTFYSSTISNPKPENVPAGNSVLFRSGDPGGGGGGGGGSGAGGAIVGGTVGGAAAAGAAAGYAGLGFLPGLLLGLASPIQFDETMIDIIANNQNAYPLLVRDIQYVYQTTDINTLASLDIIGSPVSTVVPCGIGSARFIPDDTIQNGAYELIGVKIPPQFANAPKGITVRITQKSYPFCISKNVPDMNFNVFNTLDCKQINSLYKTRRFLKSNYLSKRIACTKNCKIEADNGIVQKTICIGPNEPRNKLFIAVNYLKNGQFPRKNCNLKFDKQAYSLVVQFCENK